LSAKTNQPDWDKIAEKFDLWLPQIAPVGDALLEALDAKPGDHVLDVASGTGEPALTLARQTHGHVRITGVDAAEGMVKVAQGKVHKDRLEHISFQTMPAETLDFKEGSFDKVLCRFGVMLFANPEKGLKEMQRVLKPGGRFALAVWSTPETMPSMYWTHQVMKNRLHEDLHPPLAKVTSLGGEGVLEKMLQQAGFSQFTVAVKEVHYDFPSFDAYWDVVEASDILKLQYDALPKEDRATIRDEIAQFARDYIGPNGLRVPHQYLLATGVK